MLSATFPNTLTSFTLDFSEFPEHRVAFFKLIQAINLHCFPALLALPPPQFKMVIDSIVWAFKHTIRDVAEAGLNICIDLLKNINGSESSIANAFYQSYFISLLQDIFYVLTDADHKSCKNKFYCV